MSNGRDEATPNDEVEPEVPEDDDTLAPRGLVSDLGEDEEEDDASPDKPG